MLDFGPSGLKTTLRSLSDKGIKYAGAGADLSQALQPVVIERRGLKIALVSFMISPEFEGLEITPAGESTPGVAPIRGFDARLTGGKRALVPSDADLRQMEDTIRAAKKVADLVAVSLHIHWGDLESIDPDGKQLVARAAVDAGADMILGHGPHVVNGIEVYKTKPIIYSMGDFVVQPPMLGYEVFYPDQVKNTKRIRANERTFESMMVRMILSQQGAFRRIEILPTATTQSGDPHFVTGDKANAILERVKTLSEPFKTAIKRQSWYSVLELSK